MERTRRKRSAIITVIAARTQCHRRAHRGAPLNITLEGISMQRDMDLVRQILLALEQHPSGFAPDDLHIDGYTKEQIGYHAYIMGQAGLLEVADCTSQGSPGPEALINNMTWEGHEFIEAAREPKRWAQAKEVLHKTGGASFQVWTAVLTDLVRKSLGV